MRVGSKVRFIHGKESGIIKNIIDGKIVEVEIEDGFVIPVLKNEIVVISEQESEIFSPSETKIETSNISEKDDGIYLAYLPFNDRIYHHYIINKTNKNILFTIHEQVGSDYKGINSGILHARSFIKTGDKDLSLFDKWQPLLIQIIFYNTSPAPALDAVSKKLHPNAAAFYKHKKQIPLIFKEGHLFRLDETIREVDSEKIKDAIEDHKPPKPAKVQLPPAEVDLHLEKLNVPYKHLHSHQILQLQLETFERLLSNAISADMYEITFIHGVGNGVLKGEIHKLLKKNTEVKSFKEAQPEKFGYGATIVQLR